MLGFTRRRPDRPTSARLRPAARLEGLEGRTLLSTYGPFKYWQPSFYQTRFVSHNTESPSVGTGYNSDPGVLSRLDNEGKILTGKDRQGNEWQLTVHGPGYAIVTDATPNDGALDDDLATIQLVGTDINKTYVTGSVNPSARVVTSTSGTVAFNQLVAKSGVASIVLNGFNLEQTVAPPSGQPNNSGTGINLLGGVRYLSFNDVLAPIDQATGDAPINIAIGRPNELNQVSPTIKINSIYNTVFDSTVAVNPNGVPQTTPTVQFLIYGQLRSLEMTSATNQPLSGGDVYVFPTVGTTGRTAVRTTNLGKLKVIGTANNLTVSRKQVPFQDATSGVDSVGGVSLGGNADAIGIDSRGPIGHIYANHGIGNPAGSGTSATTYGLPDPQRGYPSFGLLGGQVVASRIGKLRVRPANTTLVTGQDPDFMQVDRTGMTKYYRRNGTALTSVAVVTAGNVDQANINGNVQTSEIKAGTNYYQLKRGITSVRGPSRINIQQNGSLIDSVVSASYAPADGQYGTVDPNTGQLLDVVGPGTIRGRQRGSIYTTGSQTQTALGNKGVGFYARTKSAGLPPPITRSTFRNGVRVSP